MSRLALLKLLITTLLSQIILMKLLIRNFLKKNHHANLIEKLRYGENAHQQSAIYSQKITLV